MNIIKRMNVLSLTVAVKTLFLWRPPTPQSFHPPPLLLNVFLYYAYPIWGVLLWSILQTYLSFHLGIVPHFHRKFRRWPKLGLKILLHRNKIFAEDGVALYLEDDRRNLRWNWAWYVACVRVSFLVIYTRWWYLLYENLNMK